MSFKTLTYQSIALAGIAQVAYLVNQLATQGKADDAALQASINSLLVIDAENPVDIYGGLSGIKLGLEQLEKQLSATKITHPEQARYAASIVYLERRFDEQPQMQKKVHDAILRAQNQATHFGGAHENVLANLADTYHNTISTINPRIMVNGDQAYIGSPEIINKIRALLLAGIRSAMLWRQCGGSRWRFLLFRRKLLREVQFLLSEIHKAEP